MTEQPDAPAIEDVDTDLEDDELDTTETDDTEPEWTPPTQSEWEAAQAKLRRANDQARRLREEKQKARTAPVADPNAPAGPSQADLEMWQGRAVRQAARAELIGRGVDADMVDLALARLRPAEIEFNTDGDPELEDWLDELEDKHPKLFARATTPAAPATPRPGRLNQAAAASGRPVQPKLDLGAQILENSRAATGKARGR